MGISTNALLKSAPSATELMYFIKSWSHTSQVSLTPGTDRNFMYLNFTIKRIGEPDEARNLALFLNDSVACDYEDFYTGPATFVSMGCWGSSEVIARALVKEYGGWFRANDCADDWTRLDQ